MKYDLILEGKIEFYPKLNNKIYNILLVDTKEKINFMIDFFKNFINQQNKNIKKKFYLGMDFEYNRVRKTERDIALFQINLESEIDDIGTIFVFYPPELNNYHQSVLIDLITNENMYKIIHGGESLDIPYLFDQLLKTEDKIHNFCKNLFDTKYLCEMGHIIENKQKKCSIYYLLEEYNVITSNKFKDLESIEEKTGPIYLIDIKIHKLDFDVFRYSLYDVLFLPDLLNKIFKNQKINIDLIQEITQIVFQYKRNINSINFSFSKIKEDVSKFNVHFIKDNDKIIILNEIYQYYWFTVYDSTKTWDNLIKITYFKDFFENLLRYLVYYKISKNNTVYISKNRTEKKLKSIDFTYYKELNKLIIMLTNQINSY